MFNRIKNAATAPSGAASRRSTDTVAGSYYRRPDDQEDEASRLIETLNSSQDELTKRKGHATQAADALRGTERTLAFLRQRAERMQKAGASGDALERIKTQYDTVYRQWRTQRLAAAAAQDAYNRGVSAYNQSVDAYSQFKTQQEEAIRQWRGTIRDSATVKAELDQIQLQIEYQREADRVAKLAAYEQQQDEKPWYEKLAGYWGGVQDTTLPTYTNPSGGNQGLVSQELQALLDRQKLLQEEYDWGQHYYYADMQEAADFGEKSQYVSTYRGGEKFNNMTGTYMDSGFDDIEYDYINRNETAKNRQALTDIRINASLLGLDDSERGEMTDEEVAIFNYVYATQGRDAAFQYIDYLASDLNARQRLSEEKEWAEFAKEDPVGMSILSVATSPLKGLSYLGQAADLIEDGKIDQNAGYNKFSYLNSAVRNQVSEEIKDSIDSEFWGEAGSFGYQTAMSMADFLTTTLVSGGNSGVAMAIMGSGAAADTVIDAKDRGLSDGQAFTLGTIAGVAEAVTEKYSLEALLDRSSLGKSAAGYIFKNVLAEGSEEGASTLINTMADIMISRDKSQWQTAINAYKADGKTEGQAFGLALRDQALTLGLDILGGALSGGVMAGGNVAITKTSYAIRDNLQSQTAPQTLQEAAQQQVTENLGGKKPAQAGTVELARPSVQVSSDVWQQSQRLAAATGRNIRLYEDAENVNGSYDPETGIIWVNTKGGDVLTQVFSHEMTHSLEQAGVYGKLSEIVLSRMQATGIDLDVAREAKRKQYERQGHALQTAAAVDQELVAEYVSKYLLADEASIVSLVKQDRTLGQRIIAWFDSILAKLGNKNAQERAFLSKARSLYAKALRQTQGVGAVQAEAKIGVEAAAPVADNAVDFVASVNAMLAAGDITDAEYDSMMDAYEEWLEEQRTASERKYSVGTAEPSTDVAQSENNEGVSSENPQGKGNYSNISLANDPTPYTYSFLTSQPDMNVVGLPELSAIRNDAGKIDTAKVVAEGLKNALSVGTKRDGKIYVENQYSGRLLRVDVSAIRHGLNGKSNRLITNARLGSRIGDVVRNAIPINALHNTSANVDGTYAMAAYATDEAGREIVAIVTVEQQSGNVVGVDAFDVTHAVSGRQKRSEQADTKSQGINPIKLTSKIRIADLIDNVNSTYRSILSEDVLKAIGEKKPIGGHYSDRVKFSLSDGDGRSQEHDADTVSKKDVARELQAILQRGGDVSELRRYVAQLEGSGGKTEQRGRSAEQKQGEAEQILEKAKRRGVSVEQYLQENTELYDVDGQWNADARRALELERKGDGRKYSVSEEAETAATEEKPDVRSSMPKKAKDYLKRVERELLWTIADKLSVPKLAGREYLQPIIQEMSDTYLREGTIPQETVELLFEKAYAQGVVVDAEFYNQYKHIKDHLRNLSVTISDRGKADIADFKDFRKRAFGTLRIVNEGGLPVDTAYQELHSMAPELFPESITHPADQLVRMYDAARSIQVTEKTVQDYYGEYEPEYRRWAKADFEEAVSAVSRDLWTVKRYADEKAAKDAAKTPATAEEAAEAYKELKAARRTYERAAAKNLLSAHDEMQVGRLLRHEIELEHLDPEKDNVKGITAVFEAKQEYERLHKLITEYKQHLRGEARKTADRFLQTANDWKDKKMGIAYSRETMERNIFDIIKDKALAQSLIDQYFTPVHKAEAAATRFKNDYRDRVRALQLSTKVTKGNLVSEAHAVQLLGEAEDNIRMLENARGRIKNRDGKNLSEWRAVIEKLWAENPNLNKGKIEKAVKEFRHIYDALFQKMNQVRVANGYEPVNYRNGYFPHFQPGDSDSILAQFGRALGIDTRIDALPTTINGLTHTFKPGIQWFGNAQERLGFNTAYDAVEGFDRYIEGVASVIYQTANIQNLRAFASQIRYRTSDDGIREQVDAIQERPGLSEKEKQQLISEIYAHGKFTLSNFVAELDEYTNLLAGKKSRYDRSIEAAMGRRVYTFLKAWEARVGANMIAGNLTSALTNFIPLTQAGAQMDRFSLLRGMLGTLQAYRSDDGIVNQSTFLTNRRGSDPLVRTWAQKASEKLGKPMEVIDGFVSDSIVRGAYYQNLKKGMSEAEAMDQADAFAASVMADRSKGAMPTLMQSTNPLFKAFTQFQLEVNNQFSEVFKDIPRRFREKGLATLAWVLLKYFLGAWIYNEQYEELIGRRPALDPIGMLCQAYDDLQNDGFGSAGANLVVNTLEQLPFSSGLTLIGVELDGGRIPASSAVPDLSAIWSAATTEGWSAEKRWKEVQDELNKLAYVVTPFGGNQISKAVKGVKAYIQGGSYTVDAEGNDVLQYPVYRDEPQDAFWSLVKAAFLGKSSLGAAQDWVDNDFKGFNAKQTAAYQELLEIGANDRDAFAAIEQVRDAGSKVDDKLMAVQNTPLTDEEKTVLVGLIMGTDMLTESGGLTQYAKFDYAIQNGMSVDQYIEYRASGADIDKYLSFRDAGATVEDAMNAGMALAELQEEVEDPSTVQKWRVVIDSADDAEKQLISLSAVMTGNQYVKVKAAYGFGVTPELYVKINELLPKYDADGNGRYTQAEVTKAISAMSARSSVKAVLWQLITGSSSAKNNPYSQSIGQRVIDALEKAKAQQEETGLSFQDEIMRQIMGG